VPDASSHSTSRYRHLGALVSLSAVLGLGLTGCGSFTAGGKNADGVQLYQQGNYQAAVEKFQEAANADPNDPDAAYNMGRVYHRLAVTQNDPAAAARAEQFYNIAIDRDANHLDAHRALAVFYVEQGQSNRAFDLLGDWAMRQSDAADPRIELARLHEEFGDKDAAKEQLLEALAIDNENPRTLAALGRIRDEAGEYAQAMNNYRKSLEYDRFQPELASRVSALQGAMSPAPLYPPPSGDTRMVDSSNVTRR
jgi:tetratricopeptide (TPR) repeat protein